LQRLDYSKRIAEFYEGRKLLFRATAVFETQNVHFEWHNDDGLRKLEPKDARLLGKTLIELADLVEKDSAS